jgi:hypothetical protein
VILVKIVGSSPASKVDRQHPTIFPTIATRARWPDRSSSIPLVGVTGELGVDVA